MCYVVDIPVDEVNAQVHCLEFEVGHERPRIEPALIFVSITSAGDSVSVEPRETTFQLARSH